MYKRQDVDCAEMGATQVCPGTHCAEAHAALNAHSRDEEEAREALLRAAGFSAPTPALLGAGDALLMDSRCIHRGGANADAEKRRRAVLYASFSVPYNAPGGARTRSSPTCGTARANASRGRKSGAGDAARMCALVFVSNGAREVTGGHT